MHAESCYINHKACVDSMAAVGCKSSLCFMWSQVLVGCSCTSKQVHANHWSCAKVQVRVVGLDSLPYILITTKYAKWS